MGKKGIIFAGLIAISYAFTVWFGMSRTDATLVEGLLQGLVTLPFLVILVGAIFIFWIFIAIYAIEAVLTVLMFVGMLVLWPLRGRDAALRWSKKLTAIEDKIAEKIAPAQSKKQSNHND